LDAGTGLTTTWRCRLHRAFREAAFLVLSACLLGLVYNGITRKGIFAPHDTQSRPDQGQPTVSPRFITFEEAAEFHHSKTAIFVDSRHAYDYRLGHIQGAINIPLNEIDLKQETLARIPRNSVLVVYCDGQECNSSIELAKHLAAAGFVEDGGNGRRSTSQ
jgi:rhodanese-related sulfurtransferase